MVILCIGETHNLINYVSFINYLSYGVTIAGLLFYRWKKPNLYRPIKVPSTIYLFFQFPSHRWLCVPVLLFWNRFAVNQLDFFQYMSSATTCKEGTGGVARQDRGSEPGSITP